MRRMKVIGDSEYGKMRDLLDLPTTAQQDADCLQLERMGQRFCIDFGYENAAAKVAEEHANAKRLVKKTFRPSKF